MDGYLKANQERWDQLTLEHKDSEFYDLAGFKAGNDRLRSIEIEELGDVGGKTLLHLQCHFGLDTLAWAKRGAHVVGADFSPQAIILANQISKELNIPAQFICTDVYCLPEVLYQEFDVVFTSYGVLHGLPDLTRWAEIIAHFLKPDGIFYMIEDHPTFRVFREKKDGELRAERSYFFRDGPQKIEWTKSYATQGEGSAGVSYAWDHSMSEIVNCLINAGLEIAYIHEFPYAARAKFSFMEKGEDGWWRLPGRLHGTIPFLFSLLATKKNCK